MAGYKGYSMSNNAVEAYESGEKPMGKWTKTDIVNEVERAFKSGDCDLTFSFALFKKIRADGLKSFLKVSSWHHTSARYNETTFFTLNWDKLASLTDAQIETLLATKVEKPASLEKSTETRRCRFLVWGGTRKHPKATEHIEMCLIEENWAMTSFGKKSVTAKGFMFMEEEK